MAFFRQGPGKLDAEQGRILVLNYSTDHMKQEFVIAIIAASSALGGVIIAQVFSLLQLFLDKKHQKHKLLRQKYEEMMFYFSASLEWMARLNSCTTNTDIFALSQSSDARKALSICLLYFPDLVDDANNYVLAQQKYFESIVTSFKQDLGFTAGGQALVHNKEKHQVATNNLFNKKDAFENAIVSTSKKYIKA